MSWNAIQPASEAGLLAAVAGVVGIDAYGRARGVGQQHTTAFVILGPVLLSRQIGARLDTDPFDADIVRARSAANLHVLQHGLFRQG